MTHAGPNWLTRAAQRCCDFAERWFPDAYVFAALAVSFVALCAWLAGATAPTVVRAFGDGYWSLIPFTMQMCFVLIGGFVVADSAPVARVIDRLAAMPRSGRGAIALVAAASMLVSLLHWGLSLVFGGLLVRALARRDELQLDYRAAGAAAYLGLGAVWAMGLSSSAAQLQANPASMPAEMLAITGVIPFTQTIFLWQSIALTAVLIVVSMLVAWWSAPQGAQARTAAAMGVSLAAPPASAAATARRPGEWLEHSALPSLALVALGGGWLVQQFWSKGASQAIASLNTYNLLFVTLGLLLHGRLRPFLDAVNRAVPATAGVLIQFPLYGSIAMLLTAAPGVDGQTLAHHLSAFFVRISSHDTFAVVMGGYSAILGFFVPSGGGKWIIEAPYVMQAANDLQYHLGWAVQIYNAAEALPNLVNPFWMLPLLAMLGLKARDIVGYTFVQLVVHLPLVLFLLWLFGQTLAYTPPAMP